MQHKVRNHMSMHTFRNKADLLPFIAEWYASDSLTEPLSVDTCNRSAPKGPV